MRQRKANVIKIPEVTTHLTCNQSRPPLPLDEVGSTVRLLHFEIVDGIVRTTIGETGFAGAMALTVAAAENA